MVSRYGKTGIAVTALAALSFMALPACVLAQGDQGDQGTDVSAQNANKKVSLTVESADLYYTLKLLFAQIKADFALDTSLKSVYVTVSLHNQPFRVALETVLRAAPIPLTYRVENGIYSIVPKVEDTGVNATPNSDNTTEQPQPTSRAQKIMRGSAFVYNPINIVETLGGRIIRAIGDMGSFGGGGMGGMQGGMGGGMGGMGGGMGGMSGGMGGMSGGMGGMSGGMGGMGGGMGGGGMSGGGGGGYR